MSRQELEELITKLEKEMSIPALKQILNGFCGFVQLCVIRRPLTGDSDNNKQKTTKNSKNRKTPKNKKSKNTEDTNTKIVLANSPVFQDLLKYCLCKLSAVIPEILAIDAKQRKEPHLLILIYFVFFLLFFICFLASVCVLVAMEAMCFLQSCLKK